MFLSPPLLPALLLQPAAAADLPALETLINSAYRGETSRRGWTTEADLLDGTRTSEAELTVLLAKPNALIMTCKDAAGTLLGSVYLGTHRDHVYVGMLAVRPDQQGRGVGRQLLAAAEAHARQLERPALRMTVFSARPELLAFYERLGYRRTGETEAFAPEPHHGRPRQPLTLLWLEKKW